MGFISTILIIAAAFGQEPASESPQNPRESPSPPSVDSPYLMKNSDAFVPYGTSQIGEPYTTGMPQDSAPPTTSEGVAPTPEAVEPTGR